MDNYEVYWPQTIEIAELKPVLGADWASFIGVVVEALLVVVTTAEADLGLLFR